MRIIESQLFKCFPEIVFGLSTKNGLNNDSLFQFNLSLTVGDDPEIVRKNREAFFNELGFTTSQIAIQKQIHSDIITIVENPGLIGESDGMITYKINIGLAVSTADCVPIFVYDKNKKVIAGIHSGWRGTQKQIVRKALVILVEKFNSVPQDLIVYIGPSVCQRNYEVGEEVAEQFEQKYSMTINGKIYLDVVQANLDMIYDFGIPIDQIEVSQLCSYEEKELLHSFRRDGKLSGRSLGVIVMREI
jgi:YfiH family protein